MNWMKITRILFVVLILAAIIALAVGCRQNDPEHVDSEVKGLVYEGVIVDIVGLNEITESLEANTSAPYQIYKVDAETGLPIPNTISITAPNGESTTAKTVSFNKDGERYSLLFEDNILTGYMQFSEYEGLLDAGLNGEWNDDEDTLQELFDAYLVEAELAIQRYRSAVEN